MGKMLEGFGEVRIVDETNGYGRVYLQMESKENTYEIINDVVRMKNPF